MVPDLDPDKPDPDPVWPDLDPAISGSGSGLPGSRSGNIRIWIRLLPDLDPVAAGSKVPHGLSGPVQALVGAGAASHVRVVKTGQTQMKFQLKGSFSFFNSR